MKTKVYAIAAYLASTVVYGDDAGDANHSANFLRKESFKEPQLVSGLRYAVSDKGTSEKIRKPPDTQNLLHQDVLDEETKTVASLYTYGAPAISEEEIGGQTCIPGMRVFTKNWYVTRWFSDFAAQITHYPHPTINTLELRRDVWSNRVSSNSYSICV